MDSCFGDFMDAAHFSIVLLETSDNGGSEVRVKETAGEEWMK